ncbi:MAG TPA: hypothetical protein VGI75_00905 [Pirellulales bacterium]|jgi:hypothetical protein
MFSASQNRSRRFRAIASGTAVIVGGSLVMTTLLGIAAIFGMLLRGDSPEAIVAQLPKSPMLAVFVTAGSLLMNVAGGYVSASIADRSRQAHALSTGAIATLVTLAMLPLWGGENQPLGMDAIAAAAILPCAALGAWLAMPISIRSEKTSQAANLSGRS